MLNIEKFISDHITYRKESFFKNDLAANSAVLTAGISGKSVLFIGGAGTIGSSYIKAILKFNIAKLVVVDINENGLTKLE
jgi:FlaA1/EpsC-like NDP-sugar epimerase